MCTIVGRPINVEKIENPTEEQINTLQEKYIKELIDLFETNKEKYLKDKNSKIEIL